VPHIGTSRPNALRRIISLILVGAVASILTVSAPATAFADSGHACAVGTTNNDDQSMEGVFCADISNSTNGGTVIVGFGAEGVCQTIHDRTAPDGRDRHAPEQSRLRTHHHLPVTGAARGLHHGAQ
jgi:hypothetical protein